MKDKGLYYRTNRRGFLRALGASAAMAVVGCKCPFGGTARPKVAAQLYSIHKIFWKKPEWCLEGLKTAGFEGVEFAGLGGHSAKEVAKYLADAGLKGMGMHVNGDIELVGDGLKKTLDFCAEAGIETVTTPHAKRDSADGYVKFGYDMGLAADAAVPYGVKVGIHTTYHHFTTVYNGVTAWDMIFREASSRLQQQIDTSNVFHTGTDVVALLKKYRTRHYSVHLKENTPSRTAVLGEHPTDGGSCVPWNDVFACLAEEDVRWLVIEAEQIPDSLDPLAASLKFVRARI